MWRFVLSSDPLMILLALLAICNCENVLRKTIHDDGRKDFIIVKEIKNNKCTCSCSCTPFEDDKVSASTTARTSSASEIKTESRSDPEHQFSTVSETLQTDFKDASADGDHPEDSNITTTTTETTHKIEETITIPVILEDNSTTASEDFSGAKFKHVDNQTSSISSHPAAETSDSSSNASATEESHSGTNQLPTTMISDSDATTESHMATTTTDASEDLKGEHSSSFITESNEIDEVPLFKASEQLKKPETEDDSVKETGESQNATTIDQASSIVDEKLATSSMINVTDQAIISLINLTHQVESSSTNVTHQATTISSNQSADDYENLDEFHENRTVSTENSSLTNSIDLKLNNYQIPGYLTEFKTSKSAGATSEDAAAAQSSDAVEVVKILQGGDSEKSELSFNTSEILDATEPNSWDVSLEKSQNLGAARAQIAFNESLLIALQPSTSDSNATLSVRTMSPSEVTADSAITMKPARESLFPTELNHSTTTKQFESQHSDVIDDLTPTSASATALPEIGQIFKLNRPIFKKIEIQDFAETKSPSQSTIDRDIFMTSVFDEHLSTISSDADHLDTVFHNNSDIDSNSRETDNVISSVISNGTKFEDETKESNLVFKSIDSDAKKLDDRTIESSNFNETSAITDDSTNSSMNFPQPGTINEQLIAEGHFATSGIATMDHVATKQPRILINNQTLTIVETLSNHTTSSTSAVTESKQPSTASTNDEIAEGQSGVILKASDQLAFNVAKVLPTDGDDNQLPKIRSKPVETTTPVIVESIDESNSAVKYSIETSNKPDEKILIDKQSILEIDQQINATTEQLAAGLVDEVSRTVVESSTQDGKQSAATGITESSTQNGKQSATSDVAESSTQDGKQSAATGITESSTQNGKQSATSDVAKSSTQDGKQLTASNLSASSQQEKLSMNQTESDIDEGFNESELFAVTSSNSTTFIPLATMDAESSAGSKASQNYTKNEVTNSPEDFSAATKPSSAAAEESKEHFVDTKNATKHGDGVHRQKVIMKAVGIGPQMAINSSLTTKESLPKVSSNISELFADPKIDVFVQLERTTMSTPTATEPDKHTGPKRTTIAIKNPKLQAETSETVIKRPNDRSSTVDIDQNNDGDDDDDSDYDNASGDGDDYLNNQIRLGWRKALSQLRQKLRAYQENLKNSKKQKKGIKKTDAENFDLSDDSSDEKIKKDGHLYIIKMGIREDEKPELTSGTDQIPAVTSGMDEPSALNAESIDGYSFVAPNVRRLDPPEQRRIQVSDLNAKQEKVVQKTEAEKSDSKKMIHFDGQGSQIDEPESFNLKTVNTENVKSDRVEPKQSFIPINVDGQNPTLDFSIDEPNSDQDQDEVARVHDQDEVARALDHNKVARVHDQDEAAPVQDQDEAASVLDQDGAARVHDRDEVVPVDTPQPEEWSYAKKMFELRQKIENEEHVASLRESESNKFGDEEKRRVQNQNLRSLDHRSEELEQVQPAEERARLEQARLLREEQLKLENLHELKQGVPDHAEIDRRRQIALQLQQLAESERRQHGQLESKKLVEFTKNKLQMHVPEPEASVHLGNNKCIAIRKFVQVFAITNPIEWIRQNCPFAKLYFPKASCARIEQLFQSCFSPL